MGPFRFPFEKVSFEKQIGVFLLLRTVVSEEIAGLFDVSGDFRACW